jgi:hypothetical protein
MRQADGLVIVPASDNQAYLTREGARATPVVFVDRPPVGLQADAVLVDKPGGRGRGGCTTWWRAATAHSGTWATYAPSPPRGSASRATRRR